MTTFYIVRHGETPMNIQRLIDGNGDADLNETGVLQAESLAEKLKDVHFDLVFSSDLLRAKRTAELVTKKRNLPISTTNLLREREYGELDGESYDVFREFDKQFEKMTEDEIKAFSPAPGYESNEMLIPRILTFFKETALKHPEKNILATTHGGVMKALLIHWKKIRPHERVFVHNTAYILLETDGIDFFVKEMDNIEKKEW